MAPADTQNTASEIAVFQWTIYGRQHVAIPSIENLRYQLGHWTSNRLIVIRGLLDEATAEVLQASGVDREFLDAYKERKAYRPKHRRWRSPVTSWWWKFPELLTPGCLREVMYVAGGKEVVLLNAALWVGDTARILLIERPVAFAHRAEAPPPSQATPLERELLEALGNGNQPLEGRLSQVIHERWIDLVSGLGIRSLPVTAYTDMVVAVEGNLDQTRCLPAAIEAVHRTDARDWEEILIRLERRVSKVAK
ncbi:cysteine protease [Trichoderma cornu-damae]|uniref:Cysteine protease n=1 Tax=Trichoderma cornu-damae TaxID=654480 RepID=A0A9P8QM41_9HYPO|nr:cysteine protease [Trichoderma cornu-damae]